MTKRCKECGAKATTYEKPIITPDPNINKVVLEDWCEAHVQKHLIALLIEYAEADW